MAVASNYYTLGRFIAHAGGAINGSRYTNSIDAFEISARSVALIELDLCRAKDELIVAHDGVEKAYGIKKPFSEVTTEEFLLSRFAKRFRPMTLHNLCDRLGPLECHVILDIKSENSSDYAREIGEISRIARASGVQDKIIPQVYSEDDREAARAEGFSNFILAMWKNFGNIDTKSSRDCISSCFDGEPDGFRALSLAARHFWRDGEIVSGELARDYFEISQMIFLHGQPPEAEGPLLSAGFGLFSHSAAAWVEADGEQT